MRRNLGDLDSLNLDLDALTGDIMFPFQTHIAEIKVGARVFPLIKLMLVATTFFFKSLKERKIPLLCTGI